MQWIYLYSSLNENITNYHTHPVPNYAPPSAMFCPPCPSTSKRPPCPSPSAHSAVPPYKDKIRTPALHHQVPLGLYLLQGQGEEGRRGGSSLSAPLSRLAWTPSGQQWMPKVVQVSYLNLRQESA